MGPSGRIGHILYILNCLGQVYAGLYLGRAPRTKETLPDFLKWRRVTRPPLVFRRLTGSQRTPGFWGFTNSASSPKIDRLLRRRGFTTPMTSFARRLQIRDGGPYVNLLAQLPQVWYENFTPISPPMY